MAMCIGDCCSFPSPLWVSWFGSCGSCGSTLVFFLALFRGGDGGGVFLVLFRFLSQFFAAARWVDDRLLFRLGTGGGSLGFLLAITQVVLLFEGRGSLRSKFDFRPPSTCKFAMWRFWGGSWPPAGARTSHLPASIGGTVQRE